MKTKALVSTFLFAIIVSAISKHSYAQKVYAQQRIIIIMMDGFGEKYYRNSAMPFLNQMEQKGIYKIVPSLMPAVTNVNNMSIATGSTPDQNGITGNVFFNEKKQEGE